MQRTFMTHLTNPDEGLVGDLTEEYRRRASRVWYWLGGLVFVRTRTEATEATGATPDDPEPPSHDAHARAKSM